MEGTIVAQRHFAMLNIKGARKDRQLSVSYFDNKGELIFEKKLPFDDAK
jgi:hypothetical protein